TSSGVAFSKGLLDSEVAVSRDPSPANIAEITATVDLGTAGLRSSESVLRRIEERLATRVGSRDRRVGARVHAAKVSASVSARARALRVRCVRERGRGEPRDTEHAFPGEVDSNSEG